MGCVRNYQLLPSLFRGNSCFDCFLLTSYLDPLLIFFTFQHIYVAPSPVALLYTACVVCSALQVPASNTTLSPGRCTFLVLLISA